MKSEKFLACRIFEKTISEALTAEEKYLIQTRDVDLSFTRHNMMPGFYFTLHILDSKKSKKEHTTTHSFSC